MPIVCVTKALAIVVLVTAASCKSEVRDSRSIVASTEFAPWTLPSFAPQPARDLPEQWLSPQDASSKAAARTVGQIVELRDKVEITSYRHRTLVREQEGRYEWDCSGMVGWVLRRTSPTALHAVKKGRPRAKDFFRTINRASTTPPRRHGWQRIPHVSRARPGDVFAFLRSPLSQSRITGHVGFFVEEPKQLDGYDHVYIARIVDATSDPHQDDTRPADGDGFGFGTMLFITDDLGATIAYGWHGTDSRAVWPARVVYGRIH